MAGEKQEQSYPMTVPYCGVCTMPTEYCEYYPDFEKCRQWLADNLPVEFEKLTTAEGGDGEDGEDGDKKKRQTRGGRGVIKAKKKAVVERCIKLSRAARGKKKFVTVITGLGTCEIDQKKAAKFFGQKFATGASVTGEDEIVIQGDCKDEAFDILVEKFGIEEEEIVDLGNKAR